MPVFLIPSQKQQNILGVLDYFKCRALLHFTKRCVQILPNVQMLRPVLETSSL